MRTLIHATRLIGASALLGLSSLATGAPPDLTAGGVPTTTKSLNLGPTGMHGWLYHESIDSSESRQILVTGVEAGSPADGILAVDDVILGADGTGANPANFTSDARRSLAEAIADAEGNSPATLNLLRWRAGSTTTVSITLQTMGTYTATAPYNCAKSALILEQGLDYVMANQDAGRFSLGTLALLAANDPSNPDNAARQARAATEAQALIETQEQIDFWKSGQIDTSSKITWNLGHKLLVLTEYYLQTNDATVLPTIEAMTVQIANGQSLFGTMGHQLAVPAPDGSVNGPYGVGYGPVNSAGMPTYLGILLAKECGISVPELDPAIERAGSFYASYSGLSAHPYGEHEPYRSVHESNGKSGLAAICFSLQPTRVEEGKFYAQMAAASASERGNGHTGPWFNYLWSPLGANVGGEEAAASHFGRISWMLDLSRRWDGGFDFNNLYGQGGDGGVPYWQGDFYMYTPALLTYAMPLRKTRITGFNQDSSFHLDSAEVTAVDFADSYDASSRTTNELIADLGSWSPKVQYLAAKEIGDRTADHGTILPTLISTANDTNAGEQRVGACFALGEIGDGSAAATLAALLDDADMEIRYASAEAMRHLPTADKLAHIDTILAAAASTATPVLPLNLEDPLHVAHHRLCMLLFYSGNAYGPKGVIWGDRLDGIDRSLLYPAIEAVAAHPIGQARSTLGETYVNLTYDDLLALSGTILDSITVAAPADRMFSGGVRTGGVEAMQMYNVADGVPACMKLIEDSPSTTHFELLGTFGGGVHTVEPDPDVIGFLESYLVENPTGALLALDAINGDTNPTPLNALKTVQLVTADDPTLDLPATSTVLRATAMDHAQGDSVFTWSKVFGPGAVTFTPNGTAAAVDTAVQFDGTPGAYEFEVTMSDSRGLTESYGTVVVLVSDGSGSDTTAPPTPGFATAPTGTSTSSVTMTAQVVTDPEGNGVKYYFTCTSGGGNDSGWQTSPIYTDTGLLPDTTYEYTVTARDLSANENASAASAPSAGSTLGLPTSTLSEGVFHILGSNNSPTANRIHNVSVNGAHAGFQGQGNVGSVSVPVDETFDGTIVDYAFIRESSTPNVIETYADGGAGLITYGSWVARGGGNLGNNSDMKLWTATDPGAPAFSSPADFTSNTGVGTFDNISGSVDISGITVGSVYFFYSGYRSTPIFSATMKDAEMVVADVPLPVFGDGDFSNNTEHFVCSINFVNNDGCDTIDWTLTSSLYNGDPHCSLKGVVLVTSTGQTSTVPNVVGQSQASAESSVRSAGFSNGTVLLRSSSTIPAGNVISQSPASGTTATENSAVNLVVSNGPPTTAVPNVLGLAQPIAESQIVAAGLVVVSVTSEHSETVPAGDVISQSPSSGSFLVEGGGVNLVVSLGVLDNTPPTPDPMTFAVAPHATGTTSIAMSATTASDPAGVEYYFTCTSGGGSDSGWQDSPDYEDTGLTPYSSYSYTVTARDKSSNSNTGTPSSAASATTDHDGPEATIIPMTSFDPNTAFNGGIAAGIDFDVDSSGDPGFQAVTRPGFLSVPADGSKSYNVTHNGITFDIQTANANLANQARWRNNANAGDLLNDFQQFFGRSATSGNEVTATVTLTGLTADTDYEVSFLNYNVGAGQTTHHYYNGPSTSDPLISSFTTSGNQNNYSTWVPGIAFNINSGASGEIVLTVQANEIVNGSDYDSRLTLCGISVVDTTTPPNSAPTWITSPINEVGGTEGEAYAATLADDVSDPDVGDTLVFAKVAGPSWLGVAPDGTLSGTPTSADVGPASFTVSVTDGIIASPVEATLNISVNGAMTTVPDVVGLAQAAAESSITGALLTVGNVTTDYSDTVAAGDVIEQGVPAGSSVPQNTPVDLVVSLGVLHVTVPDVTGLTQTAAEAAILAADLNVGIVTTAYSNTVPAGDVISQGVTAGSSVPHGTDVDLVVSLGVEMVTVPNVVGLSQSAAESSITGAQLTVGGITSEYSGSVPAGDVISQGLGAGSSVPVDSAVDLVVSLGIDPSPKLVRSTVSSVSSTAWTTVGLGQTYNSPVIIATPIYPNNTMPPVVTRITNVTSTGFDVKVDRADGQTDPVSIDVSVVVVDEGVYTQAVDGVTMEAVKYTSTVTAENNSWVAESRTFQNSYTSPVVVGQVMSANDPNWSVFWSMGSGRNQPVNSSNLNVGKHVGEDPNTVRADETIGYIVIESGSGSIEGVGYEAALGGDSIRGFGNSSNPYTYTLSGGLGSATTAAASISGMDGNNGAWAVLSGSPALTTTSIGLHACEDQMNDSEQSHTTTQVGYIVFE